MKYLVKNKLEQPVRLGKINFQPKEEKELNYKPYSDKFEVEELEEKEKKKSKGGK